MGLFNNRNQVNNKEAVPVWFMRQAGRYHQHYQNLKKDHTFTELCKSPKLACEVTMGPINDFKFDAAILFSDLLFPLEQLNLGLSYETGRPEIEHKLQNKDNFERLKVVTPSEQFYTFQKEACELLKKELPENKTLIGFIGSPFTLFTYGMEGSHAGQLRETKKALYTGEYQKFCDILLPCLVDEAIMQLKGGADAIAIFDTAAGELCFKDFKKFLIPFLKTLTKEIKAYQKDCKIIYYSKYTHLYYLETIQDDNIDVLGVDWRNDIVNVIKTLGKDYYIQGNIDPIWLHLPNEILLNNLEEYFSELQKGEVDLSRYIAGLGHGVTIQTPEKNVQDAVHFIQNKFLY